MSTPQAQLVAEGSAGRLIGASGARSSRHIFGRLIARPSVALCFGFLAIVILMAIFAPLIVKISGYDPYVFDQDAIDAATGGLPKGPLGGISSEHWFGVEPQNGRDIFARIVYGARASMAIALSATLLTMVFGTVLGLMSGFFGGRVDQIVSRLMDFLMAFPALIFMIALLSALPNSNRPLMLVAVLSIFGWPYIARVVRSQTMSVSKREFVEAAVASGASRHRVIFTEMLPNLTGTIIVMATLAVPTYIGTEAGLSFLGIGLTPPTPSWGQMIAKAVGWYTVDPMFLMIPGLFLFLTVLSFTVIGDQLQRVLDPRGRKP
ncbi:MAG TPA: ABC transporter permease [Microlunatus sp.]